MAIAPIGGTEYTLGAAPAKSPVHGRNRDSRESQSCPIGIPGLRIDSQGATWGTGIVAVLKGTLRVRRRAELANTPMRTKASESAPVPPALMPAHAAARATNQSDRRGGAPQSAASVHYGIIEYRKVMMSVFNTAEGWRIAVTKTGYPFRELHATVAETMDGAIEQAKHWVNRAELRDPNYR